MDAPLILGVSGLRGIVGESLTPEVAVRYAGAFGGWLREHSGEIPLVLICRDGRMGGGALLDGMAERLGARAALLHVKDGPVTAVTADQLPLGEGVQFVVRDVQHPDGVAVDEGDAAGRDGADPELRLRRGPDLPCDEHVERGAERAGDLVAEDDPTARQREHHRVLIAVGFEATGETATGIGSVVEHDIVGGSASRHG